MRFSNTTLGFIAVVVAAAGLLTISLVLPAEANGATLYVAASGNDNSGNNTCTSSSSPCLTFNQAYQQANPGDTVQVAAGSYGTQTLTTKNGAANPRVMITTAAGAQANLTRLTLDGSSYVTIVGNFHITNGSGNSLYIGGQHAITDATIDGFTMSGNNGNVQVVKVDGNTNNITIRNSDMANVTDNFIFQTDNTVTTGYPGGTPPNQNLTLEYNRIHSEIQSDNSVHMECLFLGGMYGFTMRGNIVYGCRGTGDMIWSLSGTVPQDPRDYVIENNYLAVGHDATNNELGYIIQGAAPSAGNGTIYRYNIFEADVLRMGTGASSNVKFIGNIGYFGSCGGNTYSKNIWKSLSCTGDRSANANILSSTNFSDYANYNFRPSSASAPQVDQGDATNFPTLDMLGHTRYGGAGPDAGPVEYGVGSGVAWDINGDGVTNGADISLLVADFSKAVGVAATPAADVNSDGVVNGADMSLVTAHFGQ